MTEEISQVNCNLKDLILSSPRSPDFNVDEAVAQSTGSAKGRLTRINFASALHSFSVNIEIEGVGGDSRYLSDTGKQAVGLLPLAAVALAKFLPSPV